MTYGGRIRPSGTLKLKVIRAKRNRWYMKLWRRIRRGLSFLLGEYAP